jgi:hypothetical protein
MLTCHCVYYLINVIIGVLIAANIALLIVANISLLIVANIALLIVANIALSSQVCAFGTFYFKFRLWGAM